MVVESGQFAAVRNHNLIDVWFLYFKIKILFKVQDER